MRNQTTTTTMTTGDENERAPLAALLWLIYMIVINVWGHLGYELMPAGFRHHWLMRWHNTTTHHDMHHRHVNANFSLYFNFWDRVMRTNHPDY